MNRHELRTLYLQNCIADAVEALLAVLDALDPDPDLEPDLGSGDDREWHSYGRRNAVANA